MKNLGIILSLVLLASCYRCGYMDVCKFEQICIGDEICEVQRCYGPAYCIRENDCGMEEHVYIERIHNGSHYGYQHHYYLSVEDGHVVDKCMECLEAPMDIIINDDVDPF